MDTRRLAFPDPLPAGTAVRIMMKEAGKTVVEGGLGGDRKTVADARETLGADLAAYVDLCIAEDMPLPPQSWLKERADDALYRVRLRAAMLGDLDIWAKARLRRMRLQAEAEEAGIRGPAPLHVPDAVEQALEARAKAHRDAVAKRANGGGGGGGGGAGAPPPVPTPPSGPRR